MPALYAFGDIHGHFEKYALILQARGLVDAQLNWSAGDAHLWLVGDLFDFGPQTGIPAPGIAVLELTMKLQQQAAAAGGSVQSLLGNHEVLILAAHRFGAQETSTGRTFLQKWIEGGGAETDLQGLTQGHAAWLAQLPAMAHAGGRLWMHADALFYKEYGSSVEAVNSSIARLLASLDPGAWEELLHQFDEHGAFSQDSETGPQHAREFLFQYGGGQIVHGHTPIYQLTGQPPETVTGPRLYAGGLCVNLDGGMYAGGPGFLHRFPDR